MTAIRVIRRKMASTAACAIAKGGSNALNHLDELFELMLRLARDAF